MTYPHGTVLNAAGNPVTSPQRRAIMSPLNDQLPTSERRVNTPAISPAWLKSVMDNAANGRPRDFIDFIDQGREYDDRISSLCERVEGVTSSLPWVVIPAPLEKSRQELATEIATACDNMLRKIVYDPGSEVGTGGYEDLLNARAAGFYHGWSVQEREWVYRDGQIVPSRYRFMHPHRFVWGDGMGTDMHIRLYDPGAQGEAGIYPGMRLDPLRYTVTRGLVRPGYPARDGLGRPAAWLYAFKSFSWKDLVQVSEQFGSPWVIGYVGGGDKGEGNWDDDAAAVLRGIVQNIRGRSRAVMSGKDRIDVVGPNIAKGALVPQEIVEMCNDGLSVLFVGATQAVEITGNTGTQASATVHEGVELRKVKRYAMTLSQATQNSDVIPWFRMNYGVGDEYCPTFWLQAEEAVDLKRELDIDLGLQRAGVSLTKAYFYDKYSRPAPGVDKQGDPTEEIAEPVSTGLFADRIDSGSSLSSPPSSRMVILGKPFDVDEDADSGVLNGSSSEYWNVASDAAATASEAAVEQSVKVVKSITDIASKEEFAERVYGALAPEYSSVMATGKFKPVVEAIYERYRLDAKGWPKGINHSFSGTDLIFQEKLASLDTSYWSKYITNPGSDASMKTFLKDWYGEKGGDLFGRMKKQTIDSFQVSVKGKLQQIHDWQAKRIINSGVVRVRGYAQVSQYHDAGIDTMEVFATSSERLICRVCRELNGTRVSVADIYSHMLAETALDPDQWIAKIKQRGPVTGEQLGDDAANKALFEKNGVQLPVHPNCHCRWRAYFG